MKKIVTENRRFILDHPYKKDWKHLLKKVYDATNVFLYSIKLRVIKEPLIEKKYRVSICAIFKNESQYLREWLEFHQIVGVDHFYMYNNFSEDDFQTVLKPYIENGVVTLIEWPYDQKQMECYKDCINNFANETKWLGFIDIDEFVVPKSLNSIYEFLQPFETSRGAVCIYWRIYGSSGFLKRDITRLVTQDFTVCWPKYCDIGKCFYNTAFGFDPFSKRNGCLHHSFWANWKGRDIPPVNIFDHVCVGDYNNADDYFPIQINHYFTKSYKEYATKCSKGDAFFAENPHDEAYFYLHEMKCTCTDYSAYRYLIKLKLALKESSVLM